MRDKFILFTTRSLRMFAYGLLSVVLVLYLAVRGLSTAQIGLLLTLTLIGDTAVSLWLTTVADQVGRRRILIAGAFLLLMAGVVFAATGNLGLLLIAAIVGVISPSGYEVGPFLPIEQAALSQTIPSADRTRVFAWYNLAGSLSTACGALAAGWVAQFLQHGPPSGMVELDSYRVILVIYAGIGLVLGLLFLGLSPLVEAEGSRKPSRLFAFPGLRLGLGRSRGVVLKLAGLFSVDAFAGGFVLQSIIAYWFHVRYGVEPKVLGSIFFGTNILAGFSGLVAARLAARFGLLNTMVFTHIPSNILLILVPLMPNLPLAIAVLLVRFSISQMDVPTRQSYMMAVVSPEERSAAGGVANVARTTGSSLAPICTGPMLGSAALLSLPFFLAGGLKIIYDLALYRSFRAVNPEEREPGGDTG